MTFFKDNAKTVINGLLEFGSLMLIGGVVMWALGILVNTPHIWMTTLAIMAVGSLLMGMWGVKSQSNHCNHYPRSNVVGYNPIYYIVHNQC